MPWRALVANLCVVVAVLAGASAAAQDSADAGTQERARALIEVLQDETARDALVDELSRIAEGAPPPNEAAAPSPAAEATPERVSIAREIARLTAAAGERVTEFAERIWRDMSGLADVVRAEERFDAQGFRDAAIRLGATILATVVVFFLIDRALQPLYGFMARRAQRLGAFGSTGLLAGSSALDALGVVLAYAAGYAMALFVFGEFGRIGVRQSLYLNAFLLVEMTKVLARGVFAPGHGALRLMPLSDRSARFANARLGLIASIVGYGILVVVPIVNVNVSYGFGRAMGVLVMVSALLLALAGIWTLKQRLAAEPKIAATGGDITAQLLRLLGPVWPWLATLYVVAVFAIAISRPIAMLPEVMRATGWSLLYIMAAATVGTILTKGIRKGVPLPASVRRDLPLLEKRVNGVVPTALKLVRLGLLVAVVVGIADTWGLLDLEGWLASERGVATVSALLSALTIIAVSYLVWLAFMSWVEYRLSETLGKLPGARERTLLALLSNAVTLVMTTLAIMLALSELGINIGPLLAGAGVLGLAIGFGAQTLVQDIITGAFIQVENAINEGDVVTVAGISGVVEKLSVRSVGIRDLSGTYHIVPFSQIGAVSNFMRGFAFHVAEIGVAYKESVPEAKAAMLEAFRRLKSGEHGAAIIGELEMHGVTALADSAVVIRARIKTRPGSQWAVGRAYTEEVKAVMDERNIEIPFPHLTLFMGSDKTGSPLPVVTQPLDNHSGPRLEGRQESAAG